MSPTPKDPALVYPDVFANLAALDGNGDEGGEENDVSLGSIAAAYGCPPPESLYDLELEGYANKIDALKGLREVTRCDLPGAVRLVGMVPVRLLEDVEPGEARTTAARLEKWGWTVRLNEAPSRAPTEFHLELTGFKSKITALKGLREVFGHGLREALELADRVPVRVLEGASSEAVRSAAARLEELGCAVQIKRGGA